MRNVLIAILLVAAVAAVGLAENKAAKRLRNCATVVQEVMDIPEQSIPKELLDKCTCVAEIPSMKKAGFIFGGRFGKGAVSCRQEGGKGSWGPPAPITLAGGSFGSQIADAPLELFMR